MKTLVDQLDESLPDHKGVVVIAPQLLGDLFGPGVKIEQVAITANGNLALMVSGHQSLPLCGPGEHVPQVYLDLTEAMPLSRSVIFRCAPPLSH